MQQTATLLPVRLERSFFDGLVHTESIEKPGTSLRRCYSEYFHGTDRAIRLIHRVGREIPRGCDGAFQMAKTTWAPLANFIDSASRSEATDLNCKNRDSSLRLRLQTLFCTCRAGSLRCCTELHGRHTVSATDTLFVSAIVEGVRRHTARRGAAVNLALPPPNYGGHPYHHVGMPGTVIVREKVVRELMTDVMLGLWNDGFRKQIIVNNHGQLWMLESAIQEFQKRYQLPGIFRVIDWHRAVREFFRTTERGGKWDTNFVHADESETSLGLLLFPEMVDMAYAVDTEGVSYLPEGHFDSSVDPFGRPSRWSEGEGHFAIEIAATPEGVVGKATQASPDKAKRPLAAILRYLTLLNDQILEAFPPGVVPPVEEVTLRTQDEMAPYLREPLSEGWRSVYALPRIGQSNEL